MDAYLCETCIATLSRIKSEPSFGKGHHHRSHRTFRNALDRGCSVCTRLEHDVQERRRDMFRQHQSSSIVSTGWEVDLDLEEDPKIVSITFSINFDKSRSTHAYYTVVPVIQGQCMGLANLNLSSSNCDTDDFRSFQYHHAQNTGSPECLALGQNWLETCIEEHTTCSWRRPLSVGGWNPTRLIHLGDPDNGNIQLCLGRELPVEVRYTTLSHCWGNELRRHDQRQVSSSQLCNQLPRVTLTQNNVAAWRRRIPYDDLMQTFQDAIQVTRSLGVRYIWIDSCCIVQDSEADWVRECSLMSQVYKFSYCNIAATAASHDREGCFRARDPRLDLPFYFDFSNLAQDLPEELESINEDRPSQLLGPYQFQRSKMWSADLHQDSPLAKRAWVFQEVRASSKV